MDNKSTIESILKQRFFVTPTGYPPQNGFMDYGPVLTSIKQNIISEFKRVFVDENTYELEPSAVLPYDVLKASGHIDKFCDFVLTDGECTVRADHFIEARCGEIFSIPENLEISYALIVEQVMKIKEKIIGESKKCKATAQFSRADVDRVLSGFQCVSKHLSDLNKKEIDFVVIANNLHSENEKPFNPSEEFNLIFKLNETQYLRPELAQSQFTNFRKLLDLNNERMPFSSLAIGRSYRNEISARGGMLRTKEFEQAEIEYYSEKGDHEGFEDVRNINVLLFPKTKSVPYVTTLGEAHDERIIESQAICYFIAKAQEFLTNIGFPLSLIRYRQHYQNEMAHYAADCWDVEIKTLSGWIECAGICDRSIYDLTVHSKEVNVRIKKHIPIRKVYEPVIDRKTVGRSLKEKFKDFEDLVAGLSQTYISKNMKNRALLVDFEGIDYEIGLKERTVDCEFYIPKVIEPSFGISRILYALVESSFMIRDERNVLSLRPKMCFLHCEITTLRDSDEYNALVGQLIKEFKKMGIRFRVNKRNCSIGKKYSSCDEIGIPFFITLDLETLSNKTLTVRERDSTAQIRVAMKDAPGIIAGLIAEEVRWSELSKDHGI